MILFRQGKNLGICQSILFRHISCHICPINKVDAVCSTHCQTAVRKLRHTSDSVTGYQRLLFTGITAQYLLPIRTNQTIRSVCADPQPIPTVHEQRTHPVSIQKFGQIILPDISFIVQNHQSTVRTTIETIRIPHHCVGHIRVNLRMGEQVEKGRFGQPQYSISGRSHPHISLIVLMNILAGCMKILRLLCVIGSILL